MKQTTLYKKDHKGKMRFWAVRALDDGLWFTYGCMGGEILQNDEPIPFGLAGRSQAEQIQLRMESRINSKLDSGYCMSIEEASKGLNTNLLGYAKPMLAKRFDQIKEIDWNGMHVQYKLNGHRCMITNDGGELIAYSRNGKVIETIDSILAGINIPEGVVLDGELYQHGISLQTISSMVRNIKRKDEIDKSGLVFVCYDLVSEVNYSKRRELIKSFELGKKAMLLNSDRIFTDQPLQIKPLLREAKEMGYEGLMLRTDNYGYEIGKRSKGLIKVKTCFDDEFMVFNITKSRDGWGILHMHDKNGNEFRATAPGTHEEKIYVANNPNKFIEKKVNLEYYEVTDKGVPFHPVATMWRNKEDE